MTSVGRCNCWITFAIENVLPEPVTPSSVWCARPLREPFHEARDGLRLVTRWLVVGLELEWARSVGHESSPPEEYSPWDG